MQDPQRDARVRAIKVGRNRSLISPTEWALLNQIDLRTNAPVRAGWPGQLDILVRQWKHLILIQLQVERT